MYVPADVAAGTLRWIGSADLDSLLTIRAPPAGSTAMPELESDESCSKRMCWEPLDIL